MVKTEWEYVTLRVRDREVLERNGQDLQPAPALHGELNFWGKQGFELAQALPAASHSPDVPYLYFLFILKRPVS